MVIFHGELLNNQRVYGLKMGCFSFLFKHCHLAPSLSTASQVAFFFCPCGWPKKKGSLLLPHGTDDPGNLGISQVGTDFPGKSAGEWIGKMIFLCFFLKFFS